MRPLTGNGLPLRPKTCIVSNSSGLVLLVGKHRVACRLLLYIFREHLESGSIAEIFMSRRLPIRFVDVL